MDPKIKEELSNILIERDSLDLRVHYVAGQFVAEFFSYVTLNSPICERDSDLIKAISALIKAYNGS